MRKRCGLHGTAVVAGPVLAALLLLSRAAGTEAQTPVFPAGTELVVVDVVVTDGDGRPVTGLAREDFVVEDEGVRQEILEFEGVDATSAPPDARETDDWTRIASNDFIPLSSRAFLIVFDDLHLSPASGNTVRRTLQKFIERQLRDTDCVTIAPTGGGAWWSGCLDTERGDIEAFVGRLEGKRRRELAPDRMSDHEAMLIHAERDQEALLHVSLRFVANNQAQTTADLTSRDSSENLLPGAEAAAPLVRATAEEVYDRVRARNEHLMGALERGLGALGRGRGRRVVVLASDGFIRDQRLGGFLRVREAARRANAAVYFLDPRGEDASIDLTQTAGHPDPKNQFRYYATAMEYAAEASAGAEALAADTGGFTVRGTDLDLGLARVAAESRAFYLLGYEPSRQGREGRFRKIKVSVRRPGVKVRARSGYYPGVAATAAAVADAPPPPVRRALDALVDETALPARMTSYVLGNAGEGRIAVLLAAEVDPAAVTLKTTDGRLAGGLDSYSSVTSRDDGQAARKQLGHDLALRPEAMTEMATTWLPVTHSYELPPGRYQARLVVKDRASGRLGSVRQSFDVPSPLGIRLTTPVLTDVLAPGEGAGDPARPIAIARRSFTEGSRLVCAVEVWAAGSAEDPAPVEIVYEVLRGDGSVVARSSPRPLARNAVGAYPDTFTLTLQRPGEYELRLRARDARSGEEVVSAERFRVVRALSEIVRP